jgi:hypothetical protein
MTMKFRLDECVVYMRAVRLAARREQNGLSVAEAFDIAESVVRRDWNPGRPSGTFVNDRNEVWPIVAPRPESKVTRKIHPVSIDSLLAVEGDVNIAEMNEIEVSPDDPLEVGMAPGSYVDEGEVGIVPEPETQTAWQEITDEDESSELVGTSECE